MATDPPWTKSFIVTTTNGDDGPIRLDQAGRTGFVLRSTITYTGHLTGLEEMEIPKKGSGAKPFATGEDGDLDIRTVTPKQLVDTDLASVPGPLRWFMNSYGLHTPAALIHDRLIPAGDSGVDGMTDQFADRYFRFMLKDLGEPWLKRWMMWAAVALRTRKEYAQWSLYLWVLVALVGISVAVVGVVTGTWWLLVVSTVLPAPAALLWGEQWGASFVAAIGALFVLPPAVVASAGWVVYRIIERVLKTIGWE